MEVSSVDAAAQAASAPFISQWNTLVSQTNWEKGRILYRWRAALQEKGAPPQEFSDEAWSRIVGGVSGQHIGRLRRVFERFGHMQSSYAGLYWSHFLAALDWNDAEMWLEGAVQNGWSVSQMRRQRWEALGAVPSETPRDDQLVVEEPEGDAPPTDESIPAALDASWEEPQPVDLAGPNLDEGPDFGDETEAAADVSAPADARRVFEDLPDLPPDLAEAVETFKLAILRHKLAHWAEVPSAHVLSALDALRELVLAPV
ncbi:MAG: hypothetical protein HYS13_21110 [Planctomycetia bacterium]|nr:hypothetical protein [Planctomycetia bacterium]